MSSTFTKNGVALLLAVGTSLAGVAAGSAINSAQGAPGQDPSSASSMPVRGSHVIEGNARDPGGEAPWAVRRYKGQTGLTCYEAGQIASGEFGRVHADGFHESPEDQPTGACGALGDATQTPDRVLVGIHRRFDGAKTADRSVLYGVADQSVVNVVIDGAGESRRLAVGKKGTFVTAYGGDYTFAELEVSYEYVDGSTKTLRAIDKQS